MSNSLSISEQLELRKCEKTIAVGLTNFREVGEALTKIRDGKLYRITHKTFESYCKEKWDFGRFQAYRMIEGSKVAKIVDNCQQKPERESQTRELATLSEKDQPKAWSDAVELAGGKQPTAKQVAKAVEEIKENKLGTLGNSLNELKANVKEALDRATEFKELQSKIQAIRADIKRLQDDGIGWHFRQQVDIDLRNVWQAIKFSMPYSDCPLCSQRGKGCKPCGGKGWLVKNVFDNLVPEIRARSKVRGGE